MDTSFKTNIKASITDLSAYVVRIRWSAIVLLLYTFLLHFRLLTGVAPGIDTEALIHEREVLYASWTTIGRQGLIFSKYLLDDYVHNPDFAVSVALVLLVTACLLVPFLAEVALNCRSGFSGENGAVLLFGMTIVSHPILTEQLYFTLQSNAVALGLLLVVLGLLAAHHWAEGKNPLWLLTTILLQILPYCTYQAMVPLFLAGAVSMTLLKTLHTAPFVAANSDRTVAPNCSLKADFCYALRLLLAFLGGFVVNQLITSLFFPTSSYLSNQIMWGQQAFTTCLHNITEHIRDVCTGNGIFYFGWYGLSCTLLLVLTLWHLSHDRGVKISRIIVTLLLLCAVYAAPFYMTILLGTQPVYRAQLVLPFHTGFLLFLCFLCSPVRSALPYAGYRQTEDTQPQSSPALPHTAGRCLAILLVALCLLTIYKEASTSSRLHYTNALREQGDVALSYALRQDIAAFTGETDYSGAVIFLGRKVAAENASCVTGDVRGRSVFDWDTDVEPQYYYSTKRMIGFMNCLGASYTFPTKEEVERAHALADTMPCYPASGSILQYGNTLIIKLSEE